MGLIWSGGPIKKNCFLLLGGKSKKDRALIQREGCAEKSQDKRKKVNKIGRDGEDNQAKGVKK